MAATEVADSIYLIETDEARMPGASGLPRSSLVYYIAGEPSAIVETGPASATPSLLDAVHSLGYDPVQLSYAIVTHVHLDHAGGAGSLARKLPNVQVVVHERGAKHLVDPSRLIEASRQAFGERFEEQYGPIFPVPERQIRSVEDGDIIDLGSRKLRVIYAPGHASHQMCLYDETSRGLFCGEALGRPQSTVVAPVAGFDPDAALETIDRIGKLNSERLLYSHGGVGEDSVALIRSVRANMVAYRELILASARAGEPAERIAERLETYQEEHPSGERPVPHQVEDIVNCHITYFKRKGML